MTVTFVRALLAAGAVALVGMGVAPASAQQMKPLTLTAGAPGGSWYGISAALAKLLTDKGLPVTAEQGQGNSNIINVDAHRAELGFAFATALHHSTRGSGVFKQPIKSTRVLTTLFAQIQHTAVTVDSGVKTFADLRGKRFASHTTASSAREVFLDILKVYGLSNLEDDMTIVLRGNPAAGGNAVRDRQAVGMHVTAGLPTPVVAETAVSIPVRLLGVTDDKYQELLKLNTGYNRAVIPGGTYKGVAEDVVTISSDTLLIADAGMSDDLAYKVVKTIGDNLKEFEASNPALKGVSKKVMAGAKVVPYHPGAIRYYKESGAM